MGKSVGGLNSSHHIRLSVVEEYQIFYCPCKRKHSRLFDVHDGRHCLSAAQVLHDGTVSLKLL
jgi:hypothetical protein